MAATLSAMSATLSAGTATLSTIHSHCLQCLQHCLQCLEHQQSAILSATLSAKLSAVSATLSAILLRCLQCLQHCLHHCGRRGPSSPRTEALQRPSRSTTMKASDTRATHGYDIGWRTARRNTNSQQADPLASGPESGTGHDPPRTASHGNTKHNYFVFYHGQNYFTITWHRPAPPPRRPAQAEPWTGPRSRVTPGHARSGHA